MNIERICFLAYLCISDCKDNIKRVQEYCTYILFNLNYFVFFCCHGIRPRINLLAKEKNAGTAATSKYSKKVISQNHVLTNSPTFCNTYFISKQRKDLIPALSAKKYRDSGGLPILCFLRCSLPTKPNPNIWFVP